jgi:tetratricopeptide (TPR) repeat protein
VLFDILGKRAAVGAIEGGVGSPLTFVPGVIRALGPAPVAWLFLGLFVLGLVFLTLRFWPVAAFAALWLALPILLSIFLGDPRALQFRYAFVLPVYLTVVAYAVVTISTLLADYLARRRPADPPSTQTAPSQAANLPTFQTSNLLIYLAWLLASLSFIATLGLYNQTKPDWRGAAAYLDEQAAPADIILTGPLWDEGRFIAYYYRGQARLLTPAAFVANIERYAAEMRAGGGRLWAVNRFAPAELPALNNLPFSGVVLSEPQLAVYEPPLLAGAALDLARQAVAAAYPWAAAAEAQGVLNPDPRTARAVALRAWGDALVAAGRPQEALAPYQTAVDIFPGWVSGFIALAETQEAVGNSAAAAEAYRQAVSFNSKWQGSEADMASELVEAGRWTAALEHYHQIIDGE